MFSKLGKALVVIGLNALMIVGILLGFGFLKESLVFLVELSTQTYSDFKTSIAITAKNILSLESHVLFGSLFCIGVISYDIMLLTSWIRSFSLTNSKNCKRCHHKIIREPRTGIDRLFSYIISLKRYRCVGCGKEYLILQRLEQKSTSPSAKHKPAYIRKD